MEKKKSKMGGKLLATLIIFSLVGQIAWVVENMYFNVFIYEMFGASSDKISAMVAASSVVATLTTILIGALSDKLGKRKVFICAGYILWGVSILSFMLVRESIIGAIFPAVTSVSAICITITIVLDCIMTFFGSSANDACFNAWLTDSTTAENRGMAEGINAMMPLMAILVVFGGAMLLPAHEKNPSESGVISTDTYWSIIFAVIGAIVIIIGIVGFFIIKEPKQSTEDNQNYFKNIIYGFKPSVVKSSPKLYIYLLLFTVFGISIQVFMPYLIIYYQKATPLGDGYVLVMVPAIVLAAMFTAIWGRIYDKLHFNKSIVPSLGLLCVGYILLFFNYGHTALLFIGSLLMMCGYLSANAVFGAVIRDNTPENKAGMFQGLRIVGQVLIPGIVGPIIGSAVLEGAKSFTDTDGVERFIPNENIFLGALVVALVLGAMLVGAIFLVRHLEKKRTANEGN